MTLWTTAVRSHIRHPTDGSESTPAVERRSPPPQRTVRRYGGLQRRKSGCSGEHAPQPDFGDADQPDVGAEKRHDFAFRCSGRCGHRRPGSRTDLLSAMAVGTDRQAQASGRRRQDSRPNHVSGRRIPATLDEADSDVQTLALVGTSSDAVSHHFRSPFLSDFLSDRSSDVFNEDYTQGNHEKSTG